MIWIFETYVPAAQGFVTEAQNTSTLIDTNALNDPVNHCGWRHEPSRYTTAKNSFDSTKQPLKTKLLL